MTNCPALAKAERALTIAGAGDPGSLAILVLSGAFNPVHSEHTRVLSLARAECERLGWRVVGGFLSPSSDDYVRRKLPGAAWSLERRVRLCELATSDSDWIGVWDGGEFSGYHAATQICHRLSKEFADVLGTRAIHGLEIMGSETAIRILDEVIAEWTRDAGRTRVPWYQHRVICCVIRPGSTAARDALHIRTVTAPGIAPVGVQVIVIEPAHTSLRGVSSAQIRALMSSGEWGAIRAGALLHPRVYEQLKSGVC